MTDPDFLDLDDVLDIHDRQLARFGGATGVRDQNLLESALATPRATFGGDFVHEDLFAMAAAYAFHIAQNQPFMDANKRTGLVAALAFLKINGYTVPDPSERLYEGMIAVAERRLDKEGLAAMLREMSRPIPGGAAE